MKLDTKFFQSAFFNVMAFSIIWAVQIFLAKLAFIAGAKVVPFTIQTSVAAICLTTFLAVCFQRQKLQTLTRNVVLGLIVGNVLHNGLGTVFSNAGISLTTAINAGFLVQFSTVTTSLLAWIVLKEKMTPSKAFTVVMIMVGTYFLITKGQTLTPHLGDILILLACCSWSAGNIVIKKLMKQHPVDADMVTFLRPLSGFPVFLGAVFLSPLYPAPTQALFHASIFDFSFLPQAILNGGLVVLLWIFLNRTLKAASASYMTMMSSVTPLLVALLAMVVLKETLIPIQWVGVFFIVISGVATQFLKIEKH
jgi:drug/metabolite transporter (DMT)-like permease